MFKRKLNIISIEEKWFYSRCSNALSIREKKKLLVRLLVRILEMSQRNHLEAKEH